MAKIYFSTADAVIDLHRQGFVHDFHLLGNDLLWIQGKSFIRAGEFAILHHIQTTARTGSNEVADVFGIIAPHHDIKGILLDHYKSYTELMPAILIKKLKDAGINAVQNNNYEQ